jgi:hypothetical protein
MKIFLYLVLNNNETPKNIKPKYSILFFLALILSMNAICQNIIVDTTKMWSMIDNYMVILGGNPKCNYIKFSIDTIIDQHNYLKVWTSKDYDKKNWESIGFIREDSSIVYFRDRSNNEGVLYNFRVKLNDTIEISNPILHLPLIKARIDSFSDTVINGKEYHLIELINIGSGNKETWIENIGSLRGIIYSGIDLSDLTGINPFLVCYFEKDNIIYHNNNYDSCFCCISTFIDYFVEKTGFKLYPNPTQDFIYILLPNHVFSQPYDLIIYDLKGNVVYTCLIESTISLYKLSTKSFNAGKYQVHLKNSKYEFIESFIKL